jgi:hypothetical protein
VNAPLSDEPVSLPPELKAKWLEALRSGKYQQAKGVLRDRTGAMCCLGVLCDVIRPDGWEVDHEIWRWREDATDNGHVQYLPVRLRTRFGFNEMRDGNSIESVLANRNDGTSGYKRHTFAEIADFIEANV